MKKCLALVLAVILAGVWCAVASASYWDEGNDGDSWETAYVIDSAEDFMLMRQRTSRRSSRLSDGIKYYKLVTDLDLSSLIGSSTDYNSYSFYGHLDGQNHTVQINIVNGDMTLSSAIFNMVSTDSIAVRNLKVTGSIRTSDNGTVGGIAEILQSGIIENCSFTGSIEGTEAAGGIVGTVDGKAVVRNCTFSGNITVSGQATATAGGIAALIMGGSIEKCTVLSGTTITSSIQQSTGNIYTASAGGIVGEAMTLLKESSITNCTSYASLEGNASYKGGIVGLTSDSEYNYMIGVQNTTLSGNTWPSQYPEVGSSSPNNPAPVIPDPVPPQTTELPVGIIQPVQLDSDILAKIAASLSTDASQLRILTSEDIAFPQEPTQAMNNYAKSDSSELIGKLNTLNVDVSGWYVFRVNLTDELYALLQGQNVSSYKFYGLHDSDSTQPNAAFITGLLNTWELFTLTGEKMDTFGTKEFLMAGLLDAGTPFSVYIAKILLALLAGGCNSGVTIGGVAICIVLAVKLLRRH